MSLKCSVLLALLIVCDTSADYWEDRNKFVSDEQSSFLGSQIKLSDKEIIVNEILMAAKNIEFMKCFRSLRTSFPPANHFFEAKEHIENSEVFKIIQFMPKGAALHIHDLAVVSTEYLVKNLTYREHLYACLNSDNKFEMHFFLTPDNRCNWTLVSELRQLAQDADTFDKWMERKLSLVVKNPQEVYPDINSVWSAFQTIFVAVTGLITYRPVFEEFFYQFMTEFHNDNVMYMELRTILAQLYELDGTIVSTVETAKVFKKITDKYVNDHPDFFGVKIIYAPRRNIDNMTFAKYSEVYSAIKKALPDFVVGFDLVGQEDVGKPLASFIDELLQLKKDGTHFFFHAGETSWEGMTDDNLIDAILLNTTRIGHGFAINKHPLVLKEIREQGIAIEISPISNQVLKLVDDLRNHPAAILMADNYPLVISSDDPSFWGARGLSYDMYEAFMGLGGLRADLRTLKQLALNSLTYSALNSREKTAAMRMWEAHWDTFLSNVLQRNNKNVHVRLET